MTLRFARVSSTSVLGMYVLPQAEVRATSATNAASVTAVSGVTEPRRRASGRQVRVMMSGRPLRHRSNLRAAFEGRRYSLIFAGLPSAKRGRRTLHGQADLSACQRGRRLEPRACRSVKADPAP